MSIMFGCDKKITLALCLMYCIDAPGGQIRKMANIFILFFFADLDRMISGGSGFVTRLLISPIIALLWVYIDRVS